MPTIPCPRCDGRGTIRTTVHATKPGQKDTHPTVGCPLCRGTGVALPWGHPLPGAAVPAPVKREEDR